MLREKIARDINKMAMAKAAAGDGSISEIEPGFLERGLGSIRRGVGSAYDWSKDKITGGLDYIKDNAESAAQGLGEFGRTLGDAGNLAAEDAQRKLMMLRQELDRLRMGVMSGGDDASAQVKDDAYSAIDAAPEYSNKVMSDAGSGFSRGMDLGAGDEASMNALLKQKRQSHLLKNLITGPVAASGRIPEGVDSVRNLLGDLGHEAIMGSNNLALQGLDTANKVYDSASRGISGSLEPLLRMVQNTGASTAAAYNTAYDNKKKDLIRSEMARNEAEANSAEADIPAQTMANIGDSIGGGIEGLMEGIKADPTARAALAVGAGGLGAAGILRLIKLLRGRGAGPAPI